MKYAVILATMVLLPLVAHAEFWGSTKSQRYHKPSCRWVAQITPEYRVKFATKDTAWATGYRPCEVCRPPGFASEPGKTRGRGRSEKSRQTVD